MLLCILMLGIGNVWGAPDTGTHYNKTISTDGTTCTWEYYSSGATVETIVAANGTGFDGTIYFVAGSNKVEYNSSQYLGMKDGAFFYLPVPSDAAGTVTFTYGGSSTSRFTTLYVGTTKQTASGMAVSPTGSGKSNSITFTNSQVTTESITNSTNTKWVKFAVTGGELKYRTISITLTTGSFLSSDPDPSGDDDDDCTATADAGADKTTTVNTGVQLGATAAASGFTGAWSIKSGSPSTATSQFSSTSSATATFTPTAEGTYTLVWTVTNGSDATCTASDEITVTVSEEQGSGSETTLIKLIDNGNLNTTDFRHTTTSLTNENYTVDGTAFTKCFALTGTNSTMVGVYDASKYIAYDSKTDAAEVKIYLYNKNSKAKKFTYIVIPEGYTTTPTQVQQSISSKGSGTVLTIQLTGRASLYCSTESGDVRFCQMTVEEKGTPLIAPRTPGYSISFVNPRFALKDNSGKTGSFEGFEINSNSAQKLLSGTDITLYTNKTQYIKFTLPVATKVQFAATFVDGAAISFNKTKEYNAEENSFTAQGSVELDAGEWYINPNGKKTNITKLTFAAPPTRYNVVSTLNNCSVSGTAIPAKILEGENISATITAEDGYVLPNDITVTGGTKSWTASTGKLTISNITSDVNITITALKTYTVMYQIGDGEGTTPTQTPQIAGASFKLAASTNLSNVGHDFDGWLCSVDGEKYNAEDSYTMTAANTTFTAQWKWINYTITCNGDEYGKVTATGTPHYDETITLTITPNSADYELNTLTVKDANNTDVQVSDDYKFTMPASNVTVTATFREKLQEFDISFDNGGHGTAPEGIHASNVTLTAITGVTGYTCTGWKADVNVKVGDATVPAGTLINKGTNVIVSQNTTFTAQWETNKYTLTWEFGEGGSTTDENYTKGEVAYNTPIIYPANSTMSRQGYIFTGWDNNKEVTLMPADDLTIIAQWEKNEYTVIYKDGTKELGTEKVAVDSHPTANGITTTKAHYTFNGWEPALNNVSAAKGETVTVNAQYSPIYAQSVNLETEAGKTEPQAINTFFSNNGYTSSIGTGGGYDAKGDAGYHGYKFKNNGDWIEFLVKAGDVVTIDFGYAKKWTINYGSSSETYVNENKSYNEKSYTAPAGADMLVKLTNTTSTSCIRKITISTPAPKHKVTYAKGDEAVTGSVPTQADVEENGTFTVAGKGDLAWTGYDFIGWNDGSADYAAGAPYTMGTADVVLTAQWAVAVTKHTVTYYDGSKTLGTEEVRENEAPTALGIVTQKDGYILQNWCSDPELQKDVVLSELSITQATSLYAKYARAYAETIDLVDLAKKYGAGKQTNIVEELAAKNYSISSIDNVVTWDYNTAGKPSDCGLKVEDEVITISFWVKGDQLVKIKVGTLEGVNSGTAELSKDGGNNWIEITGANPQGSGNPVEYTYYVSKETTETQFVLKSKQRTSNLIWSVLQSVTIENPYKLTLDATTNGGDAIDPMYYHAEPMTLPTAVNGEKIFNGWWDAPTGGKQVGVAGDKISITEDKILYAQFVDESSEARLSAITLSAGTLTPAFDKDVEAYTVTMPYGTTDIPQITDVTVAESHATYQINQAEAWDGNATVVVTAQDGKSKKTYTITMKRTPKDGISIIKAVASGTTTIGTVTGALAGSAKINTSGSYKMDTRKYFMVALADNQKFQAGDVVEINVCSVNDGNGFTLYTKMNGDDFSSSDLIIDTHDGQGSQSKVNSGINKITLPKSYTGSNAIYVGRAGSGDKYLNAGVNQVEVLRAMNPMLTAMKINGNDATINEEGKTVTIELPNNGGVVPTISFSDIKIISNTPSLTEGVLAEGEWAFDVARNYTLTDKDGDATVYAITLTEAAAPCETPAINTQPESASYCAGDEMPTLSVEASVSDGGTLVYAWFKKGDTDEQVGNAVSYQVAGAGTYYVKVKNTKDDFGDSEWVISNDAVVTLNVAAAITTQPVGATEKEVGDHITLSVTATNATGYQWYKDEEAIEGETNDTYEFDFAATASYYVMVGSACGDDIKSDVVSVIAAPQGCNTFASIPSAAPYIYTQEGEWSIAPLTSGGKLDGTQRFSENITDYKEQTNQKGLAYGRVGIKFAQATTAVTFYTSATSSRTLDKISVTSGDIAVGPSYTDVTEQFNIVKENYGGNNKNGVFTITGFFEPNKYYWLAFSSTSVNITKICTTEAGVLEETKTISAATVNSVALTPEQLSTLNSAKALTWDKVLTQPEVTMTYTITRKYEGDRTFVTDEEKTATITSDASNYYATASFDNQDYVITFPIDKDPAIKLSVETLDVSFALSAATSKSAEVTLTGYNLENGEYSVNIPTIEGLSITPTVFTVTDGQVNETFTVTFATEDRVTVATTDIVFSDGITSKTLPVTYGAMLEYTLQDVSENITWDFSKVPANPAASTGGITATEDNQVMANIAGVANNADFNSQTLMMMVAGEYAYRSSSYKCFQGKSLKFRTTVPGKVTINARLASSGSVNLKIGSTDFGNIGTTTQDYSAYVEAGDVEILATGNQPVRIYTMTFTVADHYRLDMKLDDLGTICLPYNVPIENQHGADFFKIDYQDGSFVHFIEETGELEAGMPYVFQVTGKDVALFSGEEHVDAPLSEGTEHGINGMIGTFIDMWPTDYSEYFENKYYMINTANNHITLCGANCGIYANRAYFDVEGMPTSPQQIEVPDGQAAPRRLVLGRDKSKNTPTDIDAVFDNGNAVQKFIIDNHVRIIRNGVIYDAVGRRIK